MEYQTYKFFLHNRNEAIGNPLSLFRRCNQNHTPIIGIRQAPDATQFLQRIEQLLD